jgi:hypothetical protein
MAHAYKTWVSPGTYTVKAQARCSYNPIIRSDWSPGLTVTITTPSFIITSPKGGEKWQAGTKQIISWTYTGNIGIRVKIELLDEKGTIKTITNTSVGRAGAGSYSWLIPKSRKPGDYRIRISSRSYTAISAGSLTIIAPPSITLTVPNGGETMQAGWTSYRNPNIQWKYTGDPGPNVKIELLKRGSLDSTIAASISTGSGGTGSYYWDIPPAQAPGANYKIRITSTSIALVRIQAIRISPLLLHQPSPSLPPMVVRAGRQGQPRP